MLGYKSPASVNRLLRRLAVFGLVCVIEGDPASGSRGRRWTCPHSHAELTAKLDEIARQVGTSGLRDKKRETHQGQRERYADARADRRLSVPPWLLPLEWRSIEHRCSN